MGDGVTHSKPDRPDPFAGQPLVMRTKPITKDTTLAELRELADEFVEALAKVAVENRTKASIIVRFDAYDYRL